MNVRKVWSGRKIRTIRYIYPKCPVFVTVSFSQRGDPILAGIERAILETAQPNPGL